MFNSHVIGLATIKRALIIDLVGGAVLTVVLIHFHSLFGAYVSVASSLAARLAGV
jgi:hypothetical protein